MSHTDQPEQPIRVEPTEKQIALTEANNTSNGVFDENTVIERLMWLDSHLVEHMKESKRFRTYMADLYVGASIAGFSLLTLLNKMGREEMNILGGKNILLVHDKGANDVDDLLLLRMLQKLGAHVIEFDVWRSDNSVAIFEEEYIMCITGPITPRADAFLKTIENAPSEVFWALAPGYKGSNARNPKRLAFTVKNIDGSFMNSDEADADGKFPFIVPLNIPEMTEKWSNKWSGVCALPPREERLFTVICDL